MNKTYLARTDNTTDEWYTPPHIVRALGKFDLDPCAPVNPPFTLAGHSLTADDDGLSQEWHGRVWCNPPYSQRLMRRFIEKCAAHQNAIALVFARTDTALWQDVIFPNAKAILFLRGRIKFYKADGSQGREANSPSALIAFDRDNAKAIADSNLPGAIITPN